MNRYLIYAIVLLTLIAAGLGKWVDADERALGAVPAEILAARTADAKAATDATLKIVKARVDADDRDRDAAVASQAKADAAHEAVDLGIQHRQDLAAAYFGEASHDKASTDWADLLTPLLYLRGVCAVLPAHAVGCDLPPGGDFDAGGDGGGPRPDGGHDR